MATSRVAVALLAVFLAGLGVPLKAAIGSSSVSDFDRYVQHASISYVAPIGSGLRFDVGKFVTHIGGETIETIKNNNYSHAFFYTYAIPFQDTGVRVHYDWTKEV